MAAFAADEEVAIAAEYALGVCVRELARRRRRSFETIRAAILAGGGTIRTLSEAARKVTPEQDELAAVEYLSGKSIAAVASTLGVSTTAVRGSLKRKGVAARTIHRKYALDGGVFADADRNPLAAQYVGLLMADGCVHHSKAGQHVVKLALAAEGGAHVYDFQRFLKTDLPVIVSSPRGISKQATVALAVTSAQLAADLEAYGVVPRKSMSAGVLRLGSNPHFWAGMVMGDGWFTSYRGRPVMGLCGSLSCVQQFLAFCQTVTATRANPYRVKSIWAARLTGRHAYYVSRAIFDGVTEGVERKLASAGMVAHWGRSLGL